MVADQILIENEKKANTNLIKVMIITYVVLIADSIYTISDYYSWEHKLACYIGCGIAAIAIVISVIINNKLPDKYFSHKKYYLALALLIVMGSYSLLFVQTIFVFPPIALGVFSRFYNKKYMRGMTTLTSTVILIYTIGSIATGLVKDLNVVALDPGTVIRVPDNSIWIIDALTELQISNWVYVKQYATYMIVPYLAAYIASVFIFHGLSESGNDMVERRSEEARNKAIVDRDLSIANNIQISMLPTNFDTYGGQAHADIHAAMYPARQVGGDFYDFFMLDEDRVCFLVGDVSGKGVPAALFMVKAQTCIKGMALMGLSPSKILERANDILNERNEERFFVTVWLGILNVRTGVLEYANAGHNPPFFCRKNGKYEELHCIPNFVVAMMPEIEYEPESVTMEPGDKIFIYTDGVTDTRNSDNVFYGADRLRKFLDYRRDDDVRNMLAGIRQNVLDFKGAAAPFDDLTMLILEYRG